MRAAVVWTNSAKDLAVDRVHDLLRHGRFAAAKEFLCGRNDPWALVRLAQIAFFLDNDYLQCIDHCDRAERSTGEQHEAVLARALRACAAGCLDPRTSSERFDLRDLLGIDPTHLSEIVYYIGCSRYICGDLAGACTWLDSHTPEDVSWHARYLILKGYVAAARDAFSEQAEYLSHALLLLEPVSGEEPYLTSNAARALAIVLRDVYSAKGTVHLERLYTKLSADFAGSRFHVGRALGWSRALSGDTFDAMRHFLRCLSEADNVFERAYAHLDAASAAIFAGERLAYSTRSHYALSKECIAEIDWERVVTDDVVILPLAAQVAAEIGAPEDALRFCEEATRRRSQIAPRFAMARGERLQAFIDEALAFAYLSVDEERCLHHAKLAHDSFARLMFSWRAGRMAIMQYQVTKAISWRTRAVEHLREYEQAPFRSVLEAQAQPGLTKQQEHVLRLVKLGHDTGRIAETLGISPNTVRVYLGHLYRRYEVRNRHELLAKLSGEISAIA